MGYIYNFTVLQSIYNKGEFADFRNKYFKVALDKFENSLGVQVSSENKLIKISCLASNLAHRNWIHFVLIGLM